MIGFPTEPERETLFERVTVDWEFQKDAAFERFSLTEPILILT